MSGTVDQMLDSFWRTFPPNGWEGYRLARDRLLAFREVAQRASAQRDLFLIDSALTTLADQFEENEDVDRFSAQLLAHGNYGTAETIAAALCRARALHSLERHDEEILLATSLSAEAATPNEDALRLLEPILRDHPGNVRWSEALSEKLRQALQGEPFAELPDDVRHFPGDPARFDEFALMLSRRLRVWNEQMMKSLLASDE